MVSSWFHTGLHCDSIRWAWFARSVMEEGGNPETAIEMEGGELDEQLRKQW